MNQLFYNIAGGSVHQIRREKRRNLSLPLEVETDQFVICLVLPVSFCQNLLHSRSDSEATRDGADVESPFPLCFTFSASFKNSSPGEKVRKLSSFGDWLAESLFVSTTVLKYNIYNGRSREKKICSRDQSYQRALSRF